MAYPPGTYLSATFELVSKVTLDVEAGALIMESGDMAQYGFQRSFGFGQN